MKKITIVVPVYNVEKYLRECIDSIINQTYKNLEIILVNDGSSDNSPAICDKYAKIDKRIRVIHRENKGVSVARNTGIEASSGYYITFVDSDDTIETDMLSLLHESITKNSADIAICEYIRFQGANDTLSVSSGNEVTILPANEAICNMLYQKEIPNGPVAKLYKKELLDDTGFPKNIAIGEDLLFNFNVFIKTRKVAVNSAKKYHYRVHEASAIHSAFSLKRLDGLVVAKHIDIVCKKSYPGIVNASSNRLFMEAVFILLAMDEKKSKYVLEYKECKTIVKKYCKIVALDRESVKKIRLYAAVSLVSIGLLLNLFATKRYFRNKV